MKDLNLNEVSCRRTQMAHVIAVHYVERPESGYLARMRPDGGYFSGLQSWGITPLPDTGFGPGCAFATAESAAAAEFERHVAENYTPAGPNDYPF